MLPDVNPELKPGRRYLLSSTSDDPERPWMGHTFVLDEAGTVFDPDPRYDPTDPKYSIENYEKIVGWEIVRWDP